MQDDHLTVSENRISEMLTDTKHASSRETKAAKRLDNGRTDFGQGPRGGRNDHTQLCWSPSSWKKCRISAAG